MSEHQAEILNSLFKDFIKSYALLSINPKKNITLINKIVEELQNRSNSGTLPFDLTQKHLNEQIVSYFKKKGSSESFLKKLAVEKGLCFGHSITNALMKSIGKEESWLLQKIILSSWNSKIKSPEKIEIFLPGRPSGRKTNLKEVMDHVANAIVFQHGTGFRMGINEITQENFLRKSSIDKKTGYEKVAFSIKIYRGIDNDKREIWEKKVIKKHIVIGGHFGGDGIPDDGAKTSILQKLLFDIKEHPLKDGEFLMLTSLTHACSLYYEKNAWHFLDPTSGIETRHENIIETEEEIREHLGNDLIFHYASLNKKKKQLIQGTNNKQTKPTNFYKCLKKIRRNPKPHFLDGLGLHAINKAAPLQLEKIFEKAKTSAELKEAIRKALPRRAPKDSISISRRILLSKSINIKNSFIKLFELKRLEAENLYTHGERDFEGYIMIDRPFTRIKLNGVSFKSAYFHCVDFSKAQLCDVDFQDAYLRKVNFSNANLSNANFKDLDLRTVNFYQANLSNTNLVGAKLAGKQVDQLYASGRRNFKNTNLEKIDFRNMVLEGVDFGGASIVGCRFTGNQIRQLFSDGRRDFRGVNFADADLKDFDFTGIILEDASFKGADLRNSNFSNANFKNLDLRTLNFYHANLSNANLVGAKLAGKQVDQLYASGRRNFKNTNLEKIDFRNMVLEGVDFDGASIVGCRLTGNQVRQLFADGRRDFRGVNFAGADLKGFDFTGLDLEGANFRGADLRNANFSTSHLGGAILIDAKIKGTLFNHCKFSKKTLILAKGKQRQELKRFCKKYRAQRSKSYLTMFRSDFLNKDLLKNAKTPAEKILIVKQHALNNPKSRTSQVWNNMLAENKLMIKLSLKY